MIDKLAVVASRLKDMTLVHPDQDNDHVCSHCGAPVGVYPSSMRVLNDNPQAIILCAPCAFEGMGPGDLHLVGSWDDMVRESKESVRRQ